MPTLLKVKKTAREELHPAGLQDLALGASHVHPDGALYNDDEGERRAASSAPQRSRGFAVQYAHRIEAREERWFFVMAQAVITPVVQCRVMFPKHHTRPQGDDRRNQLRVIVAADRGDEPGGHRGRHPQVDDE